MEKKKWFKRKLYGFGWTPATWQGWLALLVYLGVIVLVFRKIDEASHSGSDTLFGIFIPFLILTIAFIFLCYKTGEKPRWQWGKRLDD